MTTPYLLGTHAVTLRRQIEINAQNIANSKTSGFKKHEILFGNFESELKGEQEKISYSTGGPVWLDLTQGGFKPTENNYTVALNGPGFLMLEGDRYTRDGTIHQDAEGQLVNGQGVPFLDTGGAPITIPPGTFLSISKDGTISTSQGVITQLGVVTFEDERLMSKEGDNTYRTDQEAIPVEEPSISQQYLEESNVQMPLEMVDLTNNTTAYQGNIMMTDEFYRTQGKMAPILLK